MRIVIALTDAGGARDFEHYTINPDTQGALMTGYTEFAYGLRVELEGGDFRIYPWTSIAFVDKFNR